jgi:hypothetical protein
LLSNFTVLFNFYYNIKGEFVPQADFDPEEAMEAAVDKRKFLKKIF